MVKGFEDLFELLSSKTEYNRLRRMDQMKIIDVRGRRSVVESQGIWRRRVVQDLQECFEANRAPS